MAIVSWKSALNGLWSTATRWSGGKAPGPADDVQIAVPGKYRVTIAGSETAASLLLNDAGATLVDDGSLALGGLFSLQAGTFQLDQAGAVIGGVIAANGGKFVWSGGTLRGVTFLGLIDLSAGGSALHLAGGFVSAGVGGVGAGEIDVTGQGSVLTVDGGQTLDNLTLKIGERYIEYPVLSLNSLGDTAPVLTLGPNAKLVVVGGGVIASTSGAADEALVNQGQIIASADVDSSFGYGFSIRVAHFQNKGAIAVSNGEILDLTGTSFVNAAGATLTIGGAARSAAAVRLSDWTNAGTLQVRTGGVVYLGGSFNRAKLATVTAAGGAVAITGTLDNSRDVLQTGPGAPLPAIWLTGGTISGGVIISNDTADEPTPYTPGYGIVGAGFQSYGGTISNVAFHGTLSLTTTQQSLTIKTGITLAGANGSGSGKIDLTGYNASLTLQGSLTLDNAQVTLADTIWFDPGHDGHATLTLGAGLSITETNGEASAIRMITSAPVLGQTLVNRGAILSGGGKVLTLAIPTIVNHGLLSVGGAGVSTNPYVIRSFDNAADGVVSISTTNPYGNPVASLDVHAGGSWSNEGTISANWGGAASYVMGLSLGGGAGTWSNAGKILLGTGAVATIGGNAAWTNAGTISLAAGATLYLGGSFTTATFLSIQDAGGALHIQGQLVNSGQTLLVGAGSAHPVTTLEVGGSIVGGTIVSQGSGLSFAPSGGGVLDGTVWRGTLDLSSAKASVGVRNGLTITQVGGTGPGLIALTGASSQLTLFAGQTLGSATLDIGAASAGATLAITAQSAAVTTVTLDADFAVVQTGAVAKIVSSGSSGALVLKGSLTAAVAGGSFSISSAGFTNAGSIVVGQGDVLALQPGRFGNLAGTKLTGGRYEVEAGSTLQLARNVRIVTDAATIVLDGAGSVIQSFNLAANAQLGLDATLSVITAGGTLALLGGRNWSSTHSLSNAGSVVLAGGTMTIARLVNAGSFSGFGVVVGTVADTGGSIVATGGTLELNGVFTGIGTATIDAGAALQLDGAVAPGVTISFGGADARLALGNAGGFTGKISGFAVSDTVDLLKTQATAAVLISGNRLRITNGATVVATLRLVGDHVGDVFSVASDGHGGTNVTIASAGHSPEALIQAVAGFPASPSSAAIVPQTTALTVPPVLLAASH